MYVRPIHSQEPVPRQGREQLISTRLVVLLILTIMTMTTATNISPAQQPSSPWPAQPHAYYLYSRYLLRNKLADQTG